ncbi:MAG: methyl-accepting chemotaxis protein, partial [Methanomicrobiales archaeon HGW-Methanomicrobiales-4]
MFKNMKIGMRLGIGFAVVALLLVIVAALSLFRINTIGNTVEIIVEDRMPKVIDSSMIINDINLVARAVRNMMLLDKKDDILQEDKRISEAFKRNDERLEKLRKVIRSEKGKGLLASFDTARQAYSKPMAEARKLALEGKKKEATEALISKVRPLQATYIAAAENLIKHQSDVMTADGQKAQALAESSLVLLLALSIVAIILTIIMAWWLTRSITHPINECMDIARRVAAGETEMNIQSDAKDE